MPHQVFALPNFRDTAVDLVLCNPADPGSNGIVHYAYTVGAEDNVVAKRSLAWAKMHDFAGDYGIRHPSTIERLKSQRGYYPGESVLESGDGSTDVTDQDTLIRLGALELLANLSSGRLSTGDKDPFPHQLALQQFVRKPPRPEGLRRLLIADEVGLGKTIEVGLILRDILLSRGKIEGFRCLYLTSGGLIDDAAEKLRDVLAGVIDNSPIVDVVRSFRSYGRGNTLGVHVASMHAARLYITPDEKNGLPTGIAPDIVIIDECHHAASEIDRAGQRVVQGSTTQTYLAAQQLLSGTYWASSKPPRLGVLMSATPFRSQSQFVNLLRLLTHGVNDSTTGQAFDAFAPTVDARRLREVVQDSDSGATVVWRRQSDEIVKSWSGNRIFPNLAIVRPHRVKADDPDTPLLPEPSPQFLELLAEVKKLVSQIARSHGQSFGGFATAQLEKKLTSSSVAGACWLFSWAVRHTDWATQDTFRNDKSEGTEGLRSLIRQISQRIAQYNPQGNTGFATVRFPSDGFEFEARGLAQAGVVADIYKYSRALRDGANERSSWIADNSEVCDLVRAAQRVMALDGDGSANVGAEDAKLGWLRELLKRHPNDRFLLFTESLQTCEALQSALGTASRQLVGSMSKSDRYRAVADLCNPRTNARVLVATSAADEGLDLQVASKVIHWDLSSSPATLMQRNGRVARLGQVSDVTAYYLILAGTHEQRRDDALQARFASLGIDDEALKNRILGSLTEEQETALEEAIEKNESAIVGELLERAEKDNRVMDEQLAEIRTELQFAQVLSRADLAKRLANWQAMGLPDAAVDGLTYEFKQVRWERPVFGDVATRVPTYSQMATIASRETQLELVFDSEFLLFGGEGNERRPQLAGLAPWIVKVNRHGRHQIVPYSDTDLLGTVLQGLARLPRADFVTVPRGCLGPSFPKEAEWLLFCTHPVREAENTLPARSRPFLTYYAFASGPAGTAIAPIAAEGAEADEVHNFLRHTEQYVLSGECTGLASGPPLEEAKIVGRSLKQWVEAQVQFGAASFLEKERYFAPVPVALVRVVTTTHDDLYKVFWGNEPARRFAKAVLQTSSARADHSFRISDIDDLATRCGCDVDHALGVLGILSSAAVGKLRLAFQNTIDPNEPVSYSDVIAKLTAWWREKDISEDEWREWAQGISMQWIVNSPDKLAQ